MKRKILLGIICVTLLFGLTGCSLPQNRTESSVEHQLAQKIESRIAVEIKLDSSVSVKTSVSSVNIKNNTATFRGTYKGMGSDSNYSGTFKGTCTVNVSGDKVSISNIDYQTH